MPARVFPWLLLLLFGLASVRMGVAYVQQNDAIDTDFFGIWSWARFAATQPLATLYDPETMHRFQHTLDPLYVDQYFPFFYPPTYLLAIFPLSDLGYIPARIVWSVVTAVLFALSVLGPERRARSLAYALLAPATAWCLVTGQNGLLTAAILIGGLRCLGTRPVLGGALLGLLGIKPQLALLLPVVFAASRSWRALIAAVGSGVVIALLAGLLFGAELWPAWITARSQTWGMVEQFIARHDGLVPTVTAAFYKLGAGPALAAAGQVVAGLAACVLLWSIWRRAPFGAAAIAAVPIATLLATPYAYVYDLPMVTGGLLLALQRAWASEQTPAPLDLTLTVLGLLLPTLMVNLAGAALPIAAPLLAALLLRLTVPRAGPAGRDRPEFLLPRLDGRSGAVIAP